MAILRALATLALLAATCLGAAPDSVLRGKLIQQHGVPVLETQDRGPITLSGDEPTQKVLKDERIRGMQLEIKGRFTKPAEFALDRIETHSMVAIKDGKRYRVTYFCDVCAIRSFTPGLCVCCQQETRLDLIEPSQLP